MTTSDVLAALTRANLAGAAAILAVLLVRLPMRRLFGPEVAYRFWAAVPLAVAATFLPPRMVDGAVDAYALPPVIAGHAGLLLSLWAAGLAIALTVLGRAQVAFERAARAGRGGPAVAGIICPRVVMPADDGRYTPEERDLVRAHERAHIARQDPRASALAAALQALAWWNPLVHLAARTMRLDQELACDAAVLRRRPRDRALYARTLLKTQLATQPLPFGCYWPARGAHPLELRIGLLKQAPRGDSLAGGVLAAICVVAAGGLAWAAQPPMQRAIFVNPTTFEPAPSMSVVLLSAEGLPPMPTAR